MAILTIDEFMLIFDSERIKSLASEPSRTLGAMAYNPSIVATFINQADSFVKSLLSKQYSTETMEANNSLKRAVADIVMYYLEMRRPPVTAEVEKLYKLTILFLDQLQTGASVLENITQLLPSLGDPTVTDAESETMASGFFD